MGSKVSEWVGFTWMTAQPGQGGGGVPGNSGWVEEQMSE